VRRTARGGSLALGARTARAPGARSSTASGHRVDGETPNLVLIAGAAAPSNDGDWQFRAMGA